MAAHAEDFNQLLDRIGPLVEKTADDEGVETYAYDFENCPTRKEGHGAPFHIDDVAAALLVSNGSFGSMARLLGRRRHAVKRFVESKDDLVTLLDDVNEETFDAVEDRVILAALHGDTASGRFILSTRGSDRGYSRLTRHAGPDGGAIEFTESPRARLEGRLASLAGSGDAGRDTEGPHGSTD